MFDFLDYNITEENATKNFQKTLPEPFTEKPFIGSFVAETRHDDLALWRMYGKEGHIEARGCALTINRQKFIDAIQQLLEKEDAAKSLAAESEFAFYRVSYVENNNFEIPGNEENQAELNNLMLKLKEEIKKIDPKTKSDIAEKLNEIAYLFKSAVYKYENEVRLIVTGTGFTKTIEDTPRVYIEFVDIRDALHKVTLGPKIERAEEWASAFNYYIKQNYNKTDVEIIISHLPFK